MHRCLIATLVVACHATPTPTAPGTAAPGTAAPGTACAGSLLPSPPSLDQRGPWPVGARTIKLDDVTLEVWYPAVLGSEHGLPRVRYDLRDEMPRTEAAKIPDADNAWLDCDCIRDLPIDATHGPYPPVVFLHGAASFRAQSAFLMTQWASRGFVVIAPDLPGVGLDAVMGGEQHFPAGVPLAVLDLVTHAPDHDPLAFARAQLGAHVGLVGHSLGTLLGQTLSDRSEIAVAISMAGVTNLNAPASLALYGDHDHVANAPLHATAPTAVIHGAGHLAFTDLCLVGADRGGALAIARAHGVAIPDMIAQLATDGCGSGDAPFATTSPIIRALTTGALEETLRCDRAAGPALRADQRVRWLVP